MLKLQQRDDKFFYSILWNPVARVLKFENFSRYVAALPQGGKVLDYGAGDRPMEPMLKKKFDSYLAADYAPSNEAHTNRPDIFITDDGLDVGDETMDCVVLTEVLEHIYKPVEALKDIHRILKPGGSVIGTVPFAVGEHEAPYDFHRYTSFALRQMFEEAGFEVKDLEYVGDTIGVTAANFARTFGIVTKLFYKLKLPPFAAFYNLIIRIPELIYYALVKLGLNPGRVSYYKANPLGFTFSATKPVGKI